MTTSYAVNRRVKKILDDIVDVAFSDESEYLRDKYKRYDLKIEDTALRSRNGMYSPSEKMIVVNNVFRGTGDVVKTCLHELSHHIDFMSNGRTGHQKPFYVVYRRLIYASLDMGITKKSDFDTVGASDSGKVFRMVEEYSPRPVAYTLPGNSLVSVPKGYAQKEKLKEHGYKWNGIGHVWEKDSADTVSEEEFLKSIGITDYSVGGDGAYVKAIVYVCATGRTFEVKDILKELGFYYRASEKIWLSKVSSDELDLFLDRCRSDKKLSGVVFGLYEKY